VSRLRVLRAHARDQRPLLHLAPGAQMSTTSLVCVPLARLHLASSADRPVVASGQPTSAHSVLYPTTKSPMPLHLEHKPTCHRAKATVLRVRHTLPLNLAVDLLSSVAVFPFSLCPVRTHACATVRGAQRTVVTLSALSCLRALWLPLCVQPFHHDVIFVCACLAVTLLRLLGRGVSAVDVVRTVLLRNSHAPLSFPRLLSRRPHHPRR